jgi:hypothetical protein
VIVQKPAEKVDGELSVRRPRAREAMQDFRDLNPKVVPERPAPETSNKPRTVQDGICGCHCDVMLRKSGDENGYGSSFTAPGLGV